jgi:hypothetical protein
MGADKNSSHRMNSSYVPNSQPRVPTRTCQGHVFTMDISTLGTSPNTIQSGSTTQEAKDLANVQSHWRTICKVWSDSLGVVGGRSEGSGRTVRIME